MSEREFWRDAIDEYGAEDVRRAVVESKKAIARASEAPPPEVFVSHVILLLEFWRLDRLVLGDD